MRLFTFERRVHPKMKVYLLILTSFQNCVTLSSVKHKNRYFEMCLSVVFFIHPNRESQWGLWLFWTPLTFIICTKIVLFCSTKEKKASLFVFLNHSEASEIHTAALNHIVRTTIWSFSLRRFHHECVNWPLTEQLFGCTSPVQSVACVPHVMSSYYCSRWNLRKSGTSSIQSIQF